MNKATTSHPSTATLTPRLFRHSRWDALMVSVALLQGMLAAFFLRWQASVPLPASIAFFALGLCWNSNTISHNHLHNPFFRARWMNRAFSLYLTLLLGIPQSLWKERHLWHHAGEPAHWRTRWSSQRTLEFVALGLLWLTLLWQMPRFFLLAYLPAYGLGLWFCQLQGHYEHAEEADQGKGISHYSRWYNLLWFNDGFHAEHHRNPRLHWRALPSHRIQESQRSPWPPLLRWLARLSRGADQLQGTVLAWLERLALATPLLQRVILATHRQAFRKLLTHITAPQLDHVVIVGGGLFPRTLLILLELLPESRFTIIEQEAAHIAQAREVLAARQQALHNVTFVEGVFDPQEAYQADAIVIPLAFTGRRHTLYTHPPAPLVFVHDWLWCRRGEHHATIATWLLKGLNLVRAPSNTTAPD